MTHLRELLEALPYKVGADDCWASPQELMAAFDDAKRLGEQAVCFAIGDIGQAVALAVIPELCKLPYQTCWFEAEFEDADDPGRRLLVGMLCSEEGGGFNAAVFLRQPGAAWSLEGAVTADRATPTSTSTRGRSARGRRGKNATSAPSRQHLTHRRSRASSGKTQCAAWAQKPNVGANARP